MNKINIERLLIITASYDVRENLFWKEALDGSLEFFIHCGDLFFWGMDDLEPIKVESDVDLLEECCKKADVNGPALFASTKRKMRPQGAVYAQIPEEHRHYFDACGPEREVGPGNPCSQYDHKYLNPKYLGAC